MVQAKSAGTPHADMNTEWKQFLISKVNSFVKWDLVRFFHDNPHTADTADSIAHYVGRDATTVKTELNDLVQAGILVTQTQPDVTVYRLAKDPTIRQNIANFMQACLNRDFRVKAIRYLIETKETSTTHYPG